ncbi:hypothetical protein COO60DRAFT_1645535 [Scenedesmus sp. NREL 46B-D3]|nr:hypothetical protein COO60DRAFT_1645535 [Scenedesmus sp. NREL 46B-D3]
MNLHPYFPDAGGAAHSFQVGGYTFDAGPSFHMGLADPPGTSKNPLAQVLELLGERVECQRYSQVGARHRVRLAAVCAACVAPVAATLELLLAPARAAGPPHPIVADGGEYAAMIGRIAGPQALQEWRRLEAAMAPLQRGAATFPAAAIRSDPGMLLTAARFFGPQLLMTGLVADKLTGPFSAVVDKHVRDPWLKSMLDLECFVLSGMLAQDTLTAEMVFMFMERGQGRNRIDYPMGGSEAIISALVRGLEKHGGRLLLRSHVDHIVMEGGRAAGVALRRRSPASTPSNGSSSSSSSSEAPVEVIRARKGVVSNASVWDTHKLLAPGVGPKEWRRESVTTPQTASFLHMHLGIDATGLSPDLDCHHLVVNDWSDLEAPLNVCIASIPTQFDPALAPPGKAVVHAYTAGNEPYSVWEGLRRGSQEYEDMKQQRSQTLWKALERFIPDIRDRTELSMVGTPLTHERFLRRHRGSYGPAISASGKRTWPGTATPVPGLSVCGDSCMPGIGVPAAAASGMMAANSLAPVWDHLKVLGELSLDPRQPGAWWDHLKVLGELSLLAPVWDRLKVLGELSL